MQRIIKKGKRLTQKSYFPFICLTLLIFIYHLFLNLNSGDDPIFANQLDQYGLFPYLNMRWNTWTSRMVIESLEVTITRIPIFWKVLDTGAVALLLYSISKLTGCYANSRANWILCVAFLLYPFIELSNAGWCATTLNYLWPGAACVFTIYACKTSLSQKPKGLLLVASYFSTILAVSSEQYCAVLFILGFITIIYLLILKKFNVFIFSHFILAIIGLVFIMICPGNSARKAQEIVTWYPNYMMLNINDKIYIGVLNTINYLYRRGSLLFTALCLLNLQKNHEEGKITIMDFVAGFPLLLSIIGIAVSIKNNWFLRTISLDTLNANQNPVFISTYVPAFLGVLSFLFLFISFYNLYGQSMYTFICILTLCAGLCTSFILGFSPTIYASSLRIFFPLNVSIIVLIGLLLKKNDHALIDVKKYQRLLKTVIIFILYFQLNR
jgi:hypothetical protein